MSLKPCLTCGDLSPETYCADHKPVSTKSPENRARQKAIYTWSWVRLSEKARALQPWCTDCGHSGSRDNLLSADHLPIAHWKMEQGKDLDLTDVEVCCMRCNERRGPAGVGSKRYEQWIQSEYLSQNDGIHADLGGIRTPKGDTYAMGVGGSPITLSPDSDIEPNRYSVEGYSDCYNVATNGSRDIRR